MRKHRRKQASPRKYVIPRNNGSTVDPASSPPVLVVDVARDIAREAGFTLNHIEEADIVNSANAYMKALFEEAVLCARTTRASDEITRRDVLLAQRILGYR